MWVLLPPFIAAIAVSAYFVLILLHVPFYRRVPWEILAVVAAAAVFAIWQLARVPGAATAVAAAACVAILVAAAWFFLSFSMYRPREDRPRVGERFPDFTLPASDGSSFGLADARGRRLLVICYRGDW